MISSWRLCFTILFHETTPSKLKNSPLKKKMIGRQTVPLKMGGVPFQGQHGISQSHTGMSMVLSNWIITHTSVGWIRPLNRLKTNFANYIFTNFHRHPGRHSKCWLPLQFFSQAWKWYTTHRDGGARFGDGTCELFSPKNPAENSHISSNFMVGRRNFLLKPIGSMYGIFTYIWLIFVVNVRR